MTSTDELQLEYDAFGRLVLSLSTGERHAGVFPVRAFPFSQPDGWICFCDESGREVFCLHDMAMLSAEIRRLLEADLASREFIPRIERIISVSPGAEPTEWHVATDRGETRFKLASEDNIRRMGVRAALVVDSHGVRYLIADIRSLDSASRRCLRRYL